MITDLPVEAVIGELATALAARGSAVLVAPPGSGKTTVVPLRLLGEPWLEGRRIVVLEPRRLATRAAARRMASLLDEQVGETVGFVTRDERRTGPKTRIEVVTEGVLTRRLQRDAEQAGTGLVVFDELHERNLQTDLGLALALDARRALRPDLRLLAMSATLDASRVAAVLGQPLAPAPVISCEVRPHPVEIYWAPPPRQGRLEPHAAGVIRRALAADPGDVLVFLPGMAEILRVAELLGDPGADVRPLHGSLPPADQDAALLPSPAGRRKVVLATDIAETSLTVEGVRVVVDSGLARAPRFDARTGMTRLRTVAVSKASADQRAGRASRLGPGAAYRLWSKLEHAARRPHIDPEIAVVDLAGLVLELAAWGVVDPSTLSFLDPPPARAFEEARRLLELLGAVDASGRSTDLGRAMADLPLHPRLAHMVAAADPEDRPLACVLAALVDERDVLRRPAEPGARPTDVPTDVATRVRLVAPADRRSMSGSAARVSRSAADIARRAGVPVGPVQADHAGRVLALAFPDRLAVRRGSPGRFQLRTGTTAWVPPEDPLAGERFLVACDLDGRRSDARIRLAAPLDPDEVAARFSHEVEERVELAWVGDRLVERRQRRLGGLALDTAERRPSPGPATTAAILARLRDGRLADLPWTEGSRHLRQRVAFLRARQGEPWPDWSDEVLAATLEDWLVPAIGDATGLDDVAGLDPGTILRRRLGALARELDALAPTHLTLTSGRRLEVDYGGEVPAVAVRVQELYGTRETPTVAGEPVLLHLLSPAGRPVQITRDLAGFWAGSWKAVRKEMAGRYPRHRWPEDPAAAVPGR